MDSGFIKKTAEVEPTLAVTRTGAPRDREDVGVTPKPQEDRKLQAGPSPKQRPTGRVVRYGVEGGAAGAE